MLNNLSSDDLRRQLDENNAAMNTLAEDNQEIVELLSQRGLQAIDASSNDVAIHACVMQLDKLRSEPKPLTADELKAGGWWCADTSETARQAFELRGFRVTDQWELEDLDGCKRTDKKSVSRFRGMSKTKDLREIYLADGEFYWGAPSDQAN